jgi:hypothetical protein
MSRNIEHPNFRVPILKWWENHYDRVFIAPYPFYRLVKLEEEDVVLKGKGRDWNDWVPDGFDDIVKRAGEAISWQSMHTTISPETSKLEFYRAVWLLATGGYKKRTGFSLQKKIIEFCNRNKIFIPDDDEIPAILHPILKDFLTCFSDSPIVAWDESRKNSSILDLAALGRDETVWFLPSAIHIPCPGILISSDNDGTEVLIAMTDEAFKIADPERFFEIEPVDDQTYCDWLNPKDFFERDA